MNPVVKVPTDCTDDEIRKFCQLVRSGGQVEDDGRLIERVKGAFALVFLYADSELVGVAGLKNPSAHRKLHVFGKAKATLGAQDFECELGWVVVVSSYQGKGLSSSLAEHALSRAGKREVFATSSSDNDRMHKTLIKFGFSREGEPYNSDYGQRALELFVLRRQRWIAFHDDGRRDSRTATQPSLPLVLRCATGCGGSRPRPQGDARCWLESFYRVPIDLHHAATASVSAKIKRRFCCSANRTAPGRYRDVVTKRPRLAF